MIECKCGAQIDEADCITSSDWDDAYYCKLCGRAILIDRDDGGKKIWWEHSGVLNHDIQDIVQKTELLQETIGLRELQSLPRQVFDILLDIVRLKNKILNCPEGVSQQDKVIELMRQYVGSVISNK